MRREVAVYPSNAHRDTVLVTWVSRGGKNLFSCRATNNFWLRTLYYLVFTEVANDNGIILPNLSSCGWSYAEKEE